MVAKQRDELVASVTAYIPPQHPSVLFIWQVAVAPEARGRGLAKAMINQLLSRPICSEVRYVETTITPDNSASWALFRGLAQQFNCGIEEQRYFDKQQHFNGQHDDEFLCRIGPFFNHLKNVKNSQGET